MSDDIVQPPQPAATPPPRNDPPGESNAGPAVSRADGAGTDSRIRSAMRQLTLFSGLAEDDLESLGLMATTRRIRAGEWALREGETGDTLLIILDGELEITRTEDGEELVLAVRGPGEFLGELALLEDAPRSASARATRDTELLVISRFAFETLLSCSRSAPLTILRAVTERLRTTEVQLAQKQKLASIGTMAAGWAHELNNPAAAAGRSAAQLTEAVRECERRARGLAVLGIVRQETALLLDTLAEQAARQVVENQRLDGLAAADAEEALIEWLEARAVPEPDLLAPDLVATGWTAERLDVVAEAFPGPPLPQVLHWLAAVGSTISLVREIRVSADAISSIVGAVKRHSYLDQAAVQDVDVRQGLEDTLIMLRHRLRDVTVVREFQPDLPRIEAYGSELNQVWTNIIGNAIDAIDGRGRIVLRARALGNTQVVVQVEDDGPGIPPDIQDRLFDPFFTTKGPGQGTGLGLHISHNIVVLRHRGSLRVSSRPGRTCFEARLPVRLGQG